MLDGSKKKEEISHLTYKYKWHSFMIFFDEDIYVE